MSDVVRDAETQTPKLTSIMAPTPLHFVTIDGAYHDEMVVSITSSRIKVTGVECNVHNRCDSSGDANRLESEVK